MDGVALNEILVAGSAGFIGSHICGRLAFAEKFDIRTGQDGLDFGLVKSMVEGKRLVIHLANKPAHRLSVNNPYEIAKNNYLITLNFAEACRLSDASMVFASSCSVYGKQAVPFRENMDMKPDTPYGVTKQASEELLKMYHDTYGLDITVIRPSNVWGEGDILHEPMQVIPTWIKSEKEGKPLVVFGENTTRDFTHISDFTEGFLLACRPKGWNVYNLSSGKERKLLDIAAAISGNVVVKPLAAFEAEKWQVDNSKARRELGWEPKIEFWHALSEYCMQNLGRPADISRFAPTSSEHFKSL